VGFPESHCKADWEDISLRLDKLTSWRSEEFDAWFGILKPVLKRFVSAFSGEVDQGFWRQIVKVENCGSGSKYVSDWICSFGMKVTQSKTVHGCLLSREDRDHPYELDGNRYLFISILDIPTGNGEVNIKIIPICGPAYMTTMIAGVWL
jgi:Domain of unknown function (DUF4419)